MQALIPRSMLRWRVPETTPPLLVDRLPQDAALVAGLVLAVVGEVVVAGHRWPLARSAVAAVAVLAVPLRRVHPLPAVLAAFSARLVVDLVASRYGVSIVPLLGHALASVLIVHGLCRWAPARQVPVGLLFVVAATAAGALVGDASPSGVAMTLALLLTVTAVAVTGRYQAALIEHQRDRVRLEERNRLARELHDSLGHHLSAMAIQAQAARFVASSRPNQASAAIADIEALATEAIDDLRRMLGVLRGDPGEELTTAASLYALADPAGRPAIVLTGETDLRPLPAAVGSAVFRVAQEAITNARRHSRGLERVEIDLATGPSEVHLRVSNDGSPSGTGADGYGLIGMRERVSSLGGRVVAGPIANGWLVEARIPVGGGGR